MKKFLFALLALSLAFGQVCFADVQIDEGQGHGTAAIKFFVGRVTQNPYISADRVVIWDTTSKDGVTVKMTTTSADALVAGITMDAITGLSSDNTATLDASNRNWGRIQTWGLRNNVVEGGAHSSAAGANFCTSSTLGTVAVCEGFDNTVVNDGTSYDTNRVGAALESSDGTGTVDLMLKVD